MAVTRSLFVLLLFQLAGEAARGLFHLPVPGPVIGMVLLAVWLAARRREPDEALRTTTDSLLRVLGLLFVPAGVGIVANLAPLRSAWLPITVALLGSTLLTLVPVAWIMHRFQPAAAVGDEDRR